MTEGSYGKRMTALAAVIAFTFAALVTRLWFLQVLASEQYQGQAETNRVRLVPVPAPRGRILDRSGDPLVENKQAFVITVDRSKVQDEAALLADLADLLHVPVKQLEERLNDPDYLPYQPVPIYDQTPKTTAVYIDTRLDEFPGVALEVAGLRTYVRYGSGPMAPHLLGTLGEIDEDELADPSFAGHLPGQLVGRGGMEEYYEQYLRGDTGWKKIEVDASGDVLGTIGVQEAVPGNDLYLGLDRDIQELAQVTLADAIGAARHNVYDPETASFVKAPAGAVVVMDPDNGRVLAMASFPTFDPGIFLDGVTDREWLRLNDPKKNYPIVNRAIQGLYPPGSTFKPFVAAAAVKAGYADLNGFYDCPPDYIVPGDVTTVFHNWTDLNLGPLSLRDSLVRSCDTIYYDFGFAFYLDREDHGELMQAQLRRWGFGSETGIDIPGESDGRIPDQDWKDEVNEVYPNLFPDDLWYPGDNINMSIGQGDVLATPLQMAVAYSAIANGGTLYRPQVGLKIVNTDGDVVKHIKPRKVGRVPASRETLSFLRDALTGVTASGNGTAYLAFQGWPHPDIPVAGKTGTSEVTINGIDSTHSLFAAMAPADDPEYVVVALAEQAGHGSQVAAPIVRRVLEGIYGVESTELAINDADVD
jgi:penicillin-binding protein 2